MRAMLLAAGRGERARPLSDTMPKPLFPVQGRPLIAYSLGLLKAAGITEVIVNVHYLAEQIEQTLRACGSMGMNVHISREKYLLETGGGIANAQRLLGRQPFVVINADIVCDVDLTEVIDDHFRSGCIATMILRENPNPKEIPIVEWDAANGNVLDIRGELRRRTPTSRPMMFTGIHIMEPTVFEYILPKRETIIDGFYLPVLRENRRVHGYFTSGYWADLGTVENYRQVCDELSHRTLEHFKPLPLVSMHETPAG